MLELWRKRLDLSSMGLGHDDPAVFVRSQWQRKKDPNVYYLGYRIVVTTYLVMAWMLSIVDADNLHEPFPFHLKWLIYLTNWGFTFCTVQAVLATVMLVAKYSTWRKGGIIPDADRVPKLCLYKIYWFCFSIAIDLGLAVTMLYWVVIYKPDEATIDYLNIIVHCTNSAVMLMELCVVAHPVRMGHFYVPVTSGLAFTFFSLFYHLAGGTSRLDEPYIYPPVDWRRPIRALLVCMGACLLLMVIHCAVYLLFRFRSAIARRCVPGEDEATLPVQEQFRGFDNCPAKDSQTV